MVATFTTPDPQTAASQTQLYNTHYRRIYNTCLRIIGNTPEAEEAMHDAFLKIFAHVHKITGEKAFYAWSQSIAIRTAIDRVRKKKIRFEPVENLAVMDETPEEDAPAAWSVEAIKQKLMALPDGYRIILSMRLFEECSFEEIAAALKIKESTVRSQFARGRRKLVESCKLKVESSKVSANL
ncbi:MAG: RNA polymerase sigma factor [Prevotellaceae bacterium]|jgi:RNA polymerase sigma-70 factor (ECF subfamily)|nr:RNA polymerase sigma factor [Prevotellaceae bacterium]